MMRLSEIWVYPIKSLGGLSMSAAIVQRRGLQYDRRWMLVDETGKFVTQRELGSMALLTTAIEGSSLIVHPKNDPAQRVQIPLEIPTEELKKVMVNVWSVRCAARLLPDEINEWFSDMLGKDLRLVRMPDTTRRAADGRYAPKGQYVSFADDMPFTVIGQASLNDLNARLEEPLPMNRFRPNLVFTGGTSFVEDEWADVMIGNVPFKGVKRCARCVITTIDQETALRTAEPLKTLATFRRSGNKIYFGKDLVWMGAGENDVIHLHDAITTSPAIYSKS